MSRIHGHGCGIDPGSSLGAKQDDRRDGNIASVVAELSAHGERAVGVQECDFARVWLVEVVALVKV